MDSVQFNKANGNTLTDSNKGVSYKWDYNNMLAGAYFDVGTQDFKRTATGRLLCRTYCPNAKKVEISPEPFKPSPLLASMWGGGIWERPTYTPIFYNYHKYGHYEYTDEQLTRINTSTGYRDSKGTHIYVRDWQGNVRAVVSRDGGSTVFDQTTYYYPYGLPMAESTSPQTNPYKYTAKELLTDQSLNLADHGARMYDPAMARWLSADPLSELFQGQSEYKFCINNPINYKDRTGLYETEEDARYYAFYFNNAPVYQDVNTGLWFIALNKERNGPYESGGTMTREFGPKFFKTSSLAFSMSSYYSFQQVITYDKNLEIWRGLNNKIYEGLSGRGPNQYTGSRSLAQAKSKRFGLKSNTISAISMVISFAEYIDTKDSVGPNMKAYLLNKQLRDQSFNGAGFYTVYGMALSFGYNLGYFIEDMGQMLLDNPNFRIRINPYTGDFTPIEQTLQMYDEMGIYVY